MIKEDKVICNTPTVGKKPTRIDKWKYDLIRGAILSAIKQNKEGILFKNLPEAVGRLLNPSEKEKLGSIGWYTTTVKLDMEVRGEIQCITHENPQRLVLKK